MGKRKVTFAAYPTRALSDPRFTASHFRVLGGLAFFDRMSLDREKGAGCYASNKTIAEKVGINITNFSTVANELARWGYVVSEPHPMNKRTRIYRVIYDPLPAGKASEDLSGTHSLPTGEVSPSPRVQNANSRNARDTLPNTVETVCPENQQVHEVADEVRGQHILLNRNISCETETNSAEAAPSLRSRAEGALNGSLRNHGASLALIERALRAGGTMDFATQQTLEQYLAESERDDPLHHQAARILDTWGP